MTLLVAGAELQRAVESNDFIKGGDARCAEGVKYDFRLSTSILKAEFGRPVDANRLTEAEKAKLVVEPGEVVFVLTQELLALPSDMLAYLSPKRKLSHAGIVVVGGLCIDPGYSGRLLIGLYNLSSTPFQLLPGKKLIAATFHRLEPGERSAIAPPEAAIVDFPDELIRVMQSYRPASVAALLQNVQALRTELESLRADFHNRDDWYKRFEGSLDRHDTQIGQLIEGLEAERKVRERREDDVSQAITKMDRTFVWLRGATWAVGISLGAAAAGFIGWLVNRLSTP